MEKYYKILGLSSKEDITVEKIKKAFRKKVKKIHPDYNKSKDANKEFIILYEAYQILLKEFGESKDREEPRNFSSKIFSSNMSYWLKIIFGDNIPSYIQNGYEPTGIFGPPYS